MKNARKFSFFKFILLFILSGICFQNGFAKGMSGTYTIDAKGKGSKNYKTLSDAFKVLRDSGLIGPVVFSVANGTYIENGDASYTSGMSSTNTFTIQSASGDSSKVIIRGYLYFKNCTWVTIKQITVWGYGDCIDFYSSDNITITNCRLIGPLTGSSSVISIDPSGNYGPHDSNVVITNNYLKGNYYGIGMDVYNFSTGDHALNLKISGNTFDSTIKRAISIIGDSMVEISGNIIRGANTGIYLWECSDVKISKNIIDLPNGYAGIDNEVNYATKAHPIVIQNNFVAVGGAYTSYGLYSQSRNCKYYFNTFYIYSGNSFSFAVYFISEKTPDFENNIAISDSGYALGISSSSPIGIYDYNDLKSNNGYIAELDWTNYKTLSGWQSATAWDSNSVSKDPQFYSRHDLHIKNTALSGKAKYMASVPDDIDGQTRVSGATTIGADEITGGKAKFGVNSFCLGDSSIFTDSSFYYGLDSIKHWQWTFGDGASSTLQNPKHLYTSGGSFTIWLKITTSLGLSDSISHTTSVDTTCHRLLKGIISTSAGAPLKSAMLYLCTYTANDSVVHLIDSMRTDTSGYYSFRSTRDSVYLFAMPSMGTYPHELPTWADTGLYFPNASSIVLHLGTNIKNYRTIYGANPGGSGFVGGKVSYCYLCKNFGSGNPAAGVRVLLADSNGKVQAYTYINSNGYFSFSNIAITKYKIFVDQPLVKNTIAPTVTIQASNPFATNLGFTLYPTYLSLNTISGIEQQNNEDIISVYPNPASDKLYVDLKSGEQANSIAYISITDLSGRTLLNQSVKGNVTTIDISFLPSGIYMLRCQDKDKVEVIKFSRN